MNWIICLLLAVLMAAGAAHNCYCIRHRDRYTMVEERKVWVIVFVIMSFGWAIAAVYSLVT